MYVPGDEMMRSVKTNSVKPGRRMGEKGITLILVSALLFVLFAFFVVGVDTAYVYYIRGQLQNAADAGALGGAALLNEALGPDDQDAAKLEAEKFGEQNFAGDEKVLIQYNINSNTEGLNNDITVGFWDVTNDTYTPGGTPTNAIKVVARRTEGGGGRSEGRFGLFFGRVLNIVDMAVSRVAIAQKPAAAEVPIAICLDTCELGGTIPAWSWDPGTRLHTGGLVLHWPDPAETKKPANEIIAWTLLQTIPPTADSALVDFICDIESVDACAEEVYTDHGLKSNVIREFRCAFKDPTYDTENKTFRAGGEVESWTVIVPVLDECPPSKQGNPDPYEVIDWGQIKIVEIYTKTSPPKCPGCCRTCDDYDPLPEDIDLDDGKVFTSAIRISELNCENCATATFFARRARLVK
jgi:Flp pilus assembly protein TadG